MEVREVKKDILDLSIRKKMFLYVRANPGIHFREIQRDMNLSVGQLEFHLNELVKREVLVKETKVGNARFYVRDKFSKEERKVMNFLRKEISRDIILYLLENPDSSPTDILKVFTFSGPNLSYHLRRMLKEPSSGAA
jgi:predicted transcriptional regulator